MSKNALRIHLITQIAQASDADLARFIASFADAGRPQLPGNLAEWVPVAQAATILNLSTRHLRRLIQSHPDSTRLQRSVTDSTTHHLSQTTWHLNRLLIISLASAPRRATHAPHNDQFASTSPESVRLRKITPKTKNHPATQSDLFTS